MVKIYGCSDDLVEIEGSKYYENEIGCYNAQVRIWFEDGTVILVSYGKDCGAIWEILVEKDGLSKHEVILCYDEDADIYSDIFEIDSEIIWHEVIYNRGTGLTNREALESLSDEDLAKYLFYRGNCQEYCHGICSLQYECFEGQDDESVCISNIVKWLNSNQEENLV